MIQHRSQSSQKYVKRLKKKMPSKSGTSYSALQHRNSAALEFSWLTMRGAPYVKWKAQRGKNCQWLGWLCGTAGHEWWSSSSMAGGLKGMSSATLINDNPRRKEPTGLNPLRKTQHASLGIY